MDQIHMFMAPDAQKNQSFLVTLIDGTGSMDGEYKSIVQAHDDVFGYLGQKQLKFHLESKKKEGKVKLYDLLPFRSAALGNISGTFLSLFQMLLDEKNKLQKNITIVFVSDGEEPYNYDEISNLVEQMKQNYEIQFISVAVGDEFPNKISNHLRMSIHNQNTSCPAIFSVKRKVRLNNDFESTVHKEFVEIFQSINSLLSVSTKLKVNVPVYPYLQSTKPTYFVAPSEPFLIQGPTKQVSIGSKNITETQSIQALVKLTENSVKQQLIETQSDQQINIQTAFLEIGQIANKILEQTSEEVQNKSDSLKLTANLDLINSIAYGEIDLKQLQEQQMTELQVAYNPDKLFENLDQIQTEQKLNPTITPQQQQKKMKAQFNQVKAGCYLRSKSTMKQLDLIDSIEQIIFGNLEQLKNIKQDTFHNEKISIVKNFQETTFNSLEKIFTKNQNEMTIKLLILLKKINMVLQQFNDLAQKEILWNYDFNSAIETSLSYRNCKFEEPLVNSYFSFGFLPVYLQIQIQHQQLEQEIIKKKRYCRLFLKRFFSELKNSYDQMEENQLFLIILTVSLLFLLCILTNQLFCPTMMLIDNITILLYNASLAQQEIREDNFDAKANQFIYLILIMSQIIWLLGFNLFYIIHFLLVFPLLLALLQIKIIRDNCLLLVPNSFKFIFLKEKSHQDRFSLQFLSIQTIYIFIQTYILENMIYRVFAFLLVLIYQFSSIKM